MGRPASRQAGKPPSTWETLVKPCAISSAATGPEPSGDPQTTTIGVSSEISPGTATPDSMPNRVLTSLFSTISAPGIVPADARPAALRTSMNRAPAATRAAVVLTNENQGAVRFTVLIPSDTDLEVGVISAQAQSARHLTSVVQEKSLELAPGESASLPVHVSTTACGDTSRDAEPPLPPGRYGAWLRLTVSNGEVSVSP